MSILVKVILFSATLALSVIPALAFTEGRSHPVDFLVWGFLGCCALIIVAQVVPLILEFRKQAKHAAEQKKIAEQYRP